MVIPTGFVTESSSSFYSKVERVSKFNNLMSQASVTITVWHVHGMVRNQVMTTDDQFSSVVENNQGCCQSICEL